MMPRVTALMCGLVLAASGVAPGADSSAPEVTFNADIAPILHNRCASCHRPGQAAPFSLLTYQDAAKRAQLLRAVTQTRYMPPWHAEPGHGSFEGERRMLDSEVELLAAWVEAGAPEGGGKAPEPPRFSAGWALGEPDLVIEMTEPFSVPADGPDIYRNFPAPVPTTEDKWVRALEFRPRARSVVHHSLFSVDPSRKSLEADAADDIPGFAGMGDVQISGRIGMSGWAVGGRAKTFPAEAPIPLPAGSAFIFESHFHPSGKAEAELSSIALYFSDKPATRSRLVIPLPPLYGAGAGIDVTPGDSKFTLSDSFKLPVPVELHAVTPHAHYIGKEFKAWAELPDGGEVRLLWIRDWDFAWQDMYVYEAPVSLPAGATIHARIRYDNSAENPRNPTSPPQRVLWGRQSEDEMGAIIFTALTVNKDDEEPLKALLKEKSAKHREMARVYFRKHWRAFAQRQQARSN